MNYMDAVILMLVVIVIGCAWYFGLTRLHKAMVNERNQWLKDNGFINDEKRKANVSASKENAKASASNKIYTGYNRPKLGFIKSYNYE